MISVSAIIDSDQAEKKYFKQRKEPRSFRPPKIPKKSQKGISAGVFMLFRAAVGAILRTTAVQMRLTDVNLHLRKL